LRTTTSGRVGQSDCTAIPYGCTGSEYGKISGT
jgi:hypothetical protein